MTTIRHPLGMLRAQKHPPTKLALALHHTLSPMITPSRSATQLALGPLSVSAGIAAGSTTVWFRSTATVVLNVRHPPSPLPAQPNRCPFVSSFKTSQRPVLYFRIELQQDLFNDVHLIDIIFIAVPLRTHRKFLFSFV